MRRDDQPLPFLLVVLMSGRGQNGWNQVGKTLAHAGSRLDGKVRFFGNGLRDGFGHFELLRAFFVLRQPFRNTALFAKDRDGIQCHRP